MKDIKEMLEKIKIKPTYLLIIGIVGIMLIAFSSLFGKEKDNKSVEPTTTKLTAAEYKSELEEQVKQAVCHVNGGRVNVVITLESDIEYIYASEDKEQSKEESANGNSNKQVKDSGHENSVVVVKDSNGNETPLVVTAVMPKVKGAVVNCDGGENPDVAYAVGQVVKTALSVSEDKVCVTGWHE